MEVYVDQRFTNGLVKTGVGTDTLTPEGLLTVTGTVRKTRWFKVNPGETVEATVQMKGGSSQFRIYTSDSFDTEKLVASVNSDSADELKIYSLTYTLPINSKAKLIGVAFGSLNNGNGYFYNPKIQVKQSSAPPSLIACGLFFMPDGNLNPSFPRIGIESAVFSGFQLVVTLSQMFKDATTRPLVVVSDGTHYGKPNSTKLVASDVNIANGVGTFRMYYVDTVTKTVVAPPEKSFASLVVYY